MVQRVCVIGAGAAGLNAMKQLLSKPNLFKPMGFEQTSYVGGTWMYNEEVGKDKNGLPVHSSMYYNLKTNLPKEIMAFPGFPFPKELNSFVTHKEVQNYLEEYARHYKLTDNFKFNNIVECVSPHKIDGKVEWQVKVKSIIDTSITNWKFDAIIICNGHYSTPLLPELPGLSDFSGQILHSHDYRHPESHRGQSVLLLGGRSSGQDIALDLAPHAKQVYLCHRKKIHAPLPENVEQAPCIERVFHDGVELTDGQRLYVDCLLFCTGYRYKFPFLADHCHPDITDERIFPLFKHLIHAEHPTLSFIGIPKVVVPFPQFYCQLKLVLAVLDGTYSVPSQEAMLEDVKQDYEQRLTKGLPHRYAHHLSETQWIYNNELLSMAGEPALPKMLEEIYEYIHGVRGMNLIGYKNGNFEIENDTFKFVVNDEQSH